MNKLEDKVVLVTGASGFIGSRLVVALSKIIGIKLFLFSRQPLQSTQQNVSWLKGELGQLTPEYWQSQGVNRIDYVFHLGAFTPKYAAEANHIKQAIEDNILGTRALLESLPGKISRFIFSSTLDVYEKLEDGKVLTENSPVNPGDLYGSSKLFCERLISAWAKANDCNYAILRYGHIYGPGEDQYGKLIPVVIRNLFANQSPVIHGDGSTLRDYLYVDDVVEATLRAALVNENIDVLNVVRGESISLKEVVQLLIRLTESDKEIEFIIDKPNTSSLKFDNTLMTKALGVWLKTSLEKGLAAEVDSYRSKG
jgi:nucleoside-diphosphate-sugar epimerase